MVEADKIRLVAGTERLFAKDKRQIMTGAAFRRRDFIALAMLRAWFFGSLSIVLFFSFLMIAVVGKIPTVQNLIIFLDETGLLLAGIYLGCMTLLLTFAWIGADARYAKARDAERRYRFMSAEMEKLGRQSGQQDQDSWQGLGAQDNRQKTVEGETDEQTIGASGEDQPDRSEI